MSITHDWRNRIGLMRSLAIYYGQPWKQSAMRRLYAQFMGPGDLCFDIGAHVGNRLRVWAGLGARVVAVEPQPLCMSFLRRVYGSRPDVTLVAEAVGAQPGVQTLHISPANPTVSTLSAEWIETVQQDPSFAGVRWEETIPTPVTTLDELIERFGCPAFCKIDVEGYEEQVLAGLSQPLPALSVEYLAATRTSALACITRLESLSRYEYNWSPGESHRLQAPHWLDADDMTGVLAGLDEGSGDVYAREV